VAAEGRYLIQPLVACVGAIPVDPQLLGLCERVGCLDAGGGVVEDLAVGPHRVGGDGGERRIREHPSVDLGKRMGELDRWPVNVPEQGKQPIGAQHGCGFGGACYGIDPVPRHASDDRVERPVGWIPVLKLSVLHDEPAAAGERGHPGIDLDAQDSEAG
jgi:hypothetical protein